ALHTDVSFRSPLRRRRPPAGPCPRVRRRDNPTGRAARRGGQRTHSTTTRSPGESAAPSDGGRGHTRMRRRYPWPRTIHEGTRSKRGGKMVDVPLTTEEATPVFVTAALR